MFDHLRGTLEERTPAHAVLDVGGVGYRLAIPLSTFEKLPLPGKASHLFVVLVVREDAHRLYGFATREERAFFLRLQEVSGDPRSAEGREEDRVFHERICISCIDARARGVFYRTTHDR